MPEIVKKRPVVVIKKNRQNSKLVTVVPISMTPPIPAQDYHVKMDKGFCELHLQGRESWIKCDLINTVCLDRLNLVKNKDSGLRHAPNIGESALLDIKKSNKDCTPSLKQKTAIGGFLLRMRLACFRRFSHPA